MENARHAASAGSPIYHKSPSVEQMKGDKKFRKTLRTYQGVIESGNMVMLSDLEDFPAPALCSFCEVPIITRTKTERSGMQKFNIGFATFISVGMLTYAVASMFKDIVHECPACGCALATWGSQWHETKVHKSYKIPSADSTRQQGHGHNAENNQIGGYAKVYVGDRYVFKTASSKKNT